MDLTSKTPFCISRMAIEGSTSQVVDCDDSRFVLVETAGEGSGGRLVNDSENIKTGNLTSILRCLTLSVIEVGRAECRCCSYEYRCWPAGSEGLDKDLETATNTENKVESGFLLDFVGKGMRIAFWRR